MGMIFIRSTGKKNWIFSSSEYYKTKRHKTSTFSLGGKAFWADIAPFKWPLLASWQRIKDTVRCAVLGTNWLDTIKSSWRNPWLCVSYGPNPPQAVAASLTQNRDKSRRYLFTKNQIVCQSSCYAGGFFKGENPFGLWTTLWSHTSEFRQILRPTKMSWLNLSKKHCQKAVGLAISSYSREYWSFPIFQGPPISASCQSFKPRKWSLTVPHTRLLTWFVPSKMS